MLWDMVTLLSPQTTSYGFVDSCSGPTWLSLCHTDSGRACLGLNNATEVVPLGHHHRQLYLEGNDVFTSSHRDLLFPAPSSLQVRCTYGLTQSSWIPLGLGSSLLRPWIWQQMPKILDGVSSLPLNTKGRVCSVLFNGANTSTPNNWWSYSSPSVTLTI